MAERLGNKIDVVGKTITWTSEGLAPVVLHLDKVHQAVLDYATYHGMKQRCVDNAAEAKTASARLDAIRDMVEWYEQGGEAWERAKGGGGFKLDVGLVLTAMCNVVTKGDLDMAEKLIATTMEKRGVDREGAAKIWAETPQVATEMTSIRATKRSKISADDLLAQMLPAPAVPTA